MVVIFFPVTLATGSMHDRVAAPSTCTVQAPHSAFPQPYLVPVISNTSRSTQSNGMSGSTSTCRIFPLMTSFCIKKTPLTGSPRSIARKAGDPQEIAIAIKLLDIYLTFEHTIGDSLMTTSISPAPELVVQTWYNTDRPLLLSGLRGRVVVLAAFQVLCPKSLSCGIPQALRIYETFEPDDVAVIGLH